MRRQKTHSANVGAIWGEQMLKPFKPLAFSVAVFSTVFAASVLRAIPAVANTVYNVNFSVGDAYSLDRASNTVTTGSNTTTVTGQIVTNGNLGSLNSVNLISWNFAVAYGGNSYSFSSADATSEVYNLNFLEATSTQILANINSSYGWTFASINGGTRLYITGLKRLTPDQLSQADLMVDWSYYGAHNSLEGVVDARSYVESSSGVYILGNTSTVSAVPLPAALPLLFSGLGGLGFMGWRMRKAVAARA